MVGVDIRLNVYGDKACRNNAVVLQRVNRSRIRLEVYAGAVALPGIAETGYGGRLLGCLNDEIEIFSSTNTTIEGDGGFPDHVAFQVDHLFVGWDEEKSDQKPACNANFIRVVLEGGRNGIVTDDWSARASIIFAEQSKV